MFEKLQEPQCNYYDKATISNKYLNVVGSKEWAIPQLPSSPIVPIFGTPSTPLKSIYHDPYFKDHYKKCHFSSKTPIQK